MQHVLTKKEVDALVDNNWKISADDSEFKDLSLLLSQCELWENEVVLFPYFLSQTLERKAKIGEDCASIIKQVFGLPDTMWLSMQNFDIEFVKYMFRYLRDRDNLNLEEELIDVQRKLGQHIYE